MLRRPDDEKLYHDDTDYVTMVVSCYRKVLVRRRALLLYRISKLSQKLTLLLLIVIKSTAFR